MTRLAYDLEPTLTHDKRHYTLVPVAVEGGDAVLTVRQWVAGRGRSERSVYLVQVEPETADPESPVRGLSVSFLLLRLGRREPADPPDPYRVWLSTVDRSVRWCTCKGFVCTRVCKHVDALSHAARVCGWGLFHVAQVVAPGKS